jgi:hypothetical protein
LKNSEYGRVLRPKSLEQYKVKEIFEARHLWLTPVILAIQEADIKLWFKASWGK